MSSGGPIKEKDTDRWIAEPAPFRWADSAWLQGPMAMGRLYEFQALRDRRLAVTAGPLELWVHIQGRRITSVRLASSSGDAELDALAIALYDQADVPFVHFDAEGEHLVFVEGRAHARHPLPPPAAPTAPTPEGPRWSVDWIEGPVVIGRDAALAALAALRDTHEPGRVDLRLEVHGTRVASVRIVFPSAVRAFDDAAVALFADASLEPSPLWSGNRVTVASINGRAPDPIPDDFDWDD